MFKLVVFCASLAAVAAEPSSILPLAAPLTYSSTVLSPATSYTNLGSTIVPAPYFYSSPYDYSHYIKKRSAPFAYGGYIAPTTYLSSPAFGSPLISRAHIYTGGALTYAAPAHFIKKRSASADPGVFLPSYYTPTTYAGNPLLTSTYTTTGPTVHASPFIAAPFGYPHFINKRSAPVTTSFLVPSAYSTQSRNDLRTSSPGFIYSYASPVAYSSPIISRYF